MVLEYGGFADTAVGINFKKGVSVSVGPSNFKDSLIMSWRLTKNKIWLNYSFIVFSSFCGILKE